MFIPEDADCKLCILNMEEEGKYHINTPGGLNSKGETQCECNITESPRLNTVTVAKHEVKAFQHVSSKVKPKALQAAFVLYSHLILTSACNISEFEFILSAPPGETHPRNVRQLPVGSRALLWRLAQERHRNHSLKETVPFFHIFAGIIKHCKGIYRPFIETLWNKNPRCTVCVDIVLEVLFPI